MHYHSMYNVYATLFLGTFLLASHGRTNPVDTRDLLEDAYVLEPRYHAKFATGLLSGRDAFVAQPDVLLLKPHAYPQRRTAPSRKRGSAAHAATPRVGKSPTPGEKKTPGHKKLPPTPNGKCKKRRSLSRSSKTLHKRADLETLYNNVPKANRVTVGGTKYIPLDTTRGSSYTTSEFYGCTVVIVASGKGLIIGHYKQEQGGCILMSDKAKVEQFVITQLQELIDSYGDKLGDNAKVILITVAPKSVGIARIKEFLEEEGISGSNIEEHVYIPGSAFGDFLGPQGKALVEWISKAGGGAQMKIYVESDTPMHTQDFDAEGNPC